jgi:hypothetical protein
MTMFLLSFLIITLAGLGLAVGVIAGNGGMRRTCGQVSGSGATRSKCSVCGRQPVDGRDT